MANDPVAPTTTPKPWAPRLRPENISALEELRNDPSLTAPKVERPEGAVEDFGIPLQKIEEAKGQKEEVPEDDGVEYDGSQYNNKAFRDEVEARCGKMEMIEVAGTFRYQQEIDVLPGKLKITLVSQNTEEICHINDRTRGSSVSDLISIRIEDLAVSLRSMEGSFLPRKVTFQEPLALSEGKTVWRPEVFEANLQLLKRLPADLTFILVPQFWWFRARISSELSVKNLKKSSNPT